MEELIFFAGYIAVMVLLVVAEIIILSNDKSQYLNRSYNALSNICSRNKDAKSNDLRLFTNEINRFYDEYVQETPKIKKYFPNVVVWIDAIIFRIDYGNKRADVLKEYVGILKEVRDKLEEDNPFNKCEKYQQGILCDIKKLESNENGLLVENILNRAEEEFLRLSLEAKKNRKLNTVSIAIAILGIVIPIITAFFKI